METWIDLDGLFATPLARFRFVRSARLQPLMPDLRSRLRRKFSVQALDPEVVDATSLSVVIEQLLQRLSLLHPNNPDRRTTQVTPPDYVALLDSGMCDEAVRLGAALSDREDAAVGWVDANSEQFVVDRLGAVGVRNRLICAPVVRPNIGRAASLGSHEGVGKPMR